MSSSVQFHQKACWQLNTTIYCCSENITADIIAIISTTISWQPRYIKRSSGTRRKVARDTRRSERTIAVFQSRLGVSQAFQYSSPNLQPYLQSEIIALLQLVFNTKLVSVANHLFQCQEVPIVGISIDQWEAPSEGAIFYGPNIEENDEDVLSSETY